MPVDSRRRARLGEHFRHCTAEAADDGVLLNGEDRRDMRSGLGEALAVETGTAFTRVAGIARG
jgi:hypothetical protein